MRAHTRRRSAPRQCRLTRLVALVAAVGQLLVAAAGWADAADGAAAWDARAHVEQDGTQLHHAHAESQCALCAAQHIVSPAPPRVAGPPLALNTPSAPAERAVSARAHESRGPRLPRAPPLES